MERQSRLKMNSEEAQDQLYGLQAEFCKGMAHPKRIQILATLKSGEKSVSDLSRLTGISQSNMSQHLALLRQLGLLSARREGNNIYYDISDQRIVQACELVRSCIGENLKRSQLVIDVKR